MITILVVDDNEDSRLVIVRALTHHGYTVRCASNGIDALGSMKQVRPDLVISDVFMPEMDGFQLCREVKGTPEFKDIVFVFYTAT